MSQRLRHCRGHFPGNAGRSETQHRGAGSGCRNAIGPKAEDTKLERTVALKFLASNLLEDEEGRARFIREAKAAASLDHQNICTVHEIDEVEGETFIAMAYIEAPENS